MEQSVQDKVGQRIKGPYLTFLETPDAAERLRTAYAIILQGRPHKVSTDRNGLRALPLQN